jgi:hypothetical protein
MQNKKIIAASFVYIKACRNPPHTHNYVRYAKYRTLNWHTAYNYI